MIKELSKTEFTPEELKKQRERDDILIKTLEADVVFYITKEGGFHFIVDDNVSDAQLEVLPEIFKGVVEDTKKQGWMYDARTSTGTPEQ